MYVLYTDLDQSPDDHPPICRDGVEIDVAFHVVLLPANLEASRETEREREAQHGKERNIRTVQKI